MSTSYVGAIEQLEVPRLANDIYPASARVARMVLDPLRGIARDSEEVRQLLHTQTANVLACLLIQRLTNQSALLLL